MRKNIIFTITDAKFGDFTINHWLKSLKTSVNLKNIDIVILDYGMTEEQIEKLSKEKVIVVKCIRDGHVTTIRHRDIANFLMKNKGKYDQVLLTDGGDIIFQDDINKMFNQGKDKFRIVCEAYNLFDFQKIFYNLFSKENAEKIKNTLDGKGMINAGVIFGPCDKFIKTSSMIFDIIEDKSKFGPDQVALNYILYKNNNYLCIDEKYNFVISTAKSRFYIKDGVFFIKRTNDKIPIVHNTGWFSFLRPISDFGYGPECSKVKKVYLLLLKAIGRSRKLSLFKP